LKGKSNKRVIILNKKNEFLDKLVELNKEVDSLKSEALDLFDSEIEKALRTISDTLSNYLKEAKPDFVKK
jgi:predicted phage-related endonuclease